ncbi:MAG: alpha/beta fold hydrolase [Gordonia sp. (in: high G+C Gram-positive bacteria)]
MKPYDRPVGQGGVHAADTHAKDSRSPLSSTCGGKPPVLLTHGMMGGAWQFERMQAALANAGYQSVAINYRGHHDSRPGADLGRVRVRDYLLDALSACAYLGTTPIVIGQSMGGLVAQMLAERGAARSLVLVCSLPPRGVTWRGARKPTLRMAAPSQGFHRPTTCA